MRIRKTAVILTGLSLLFSLSACKEPSSEQSTPPEEPVISIPEPAAEESAPQEKEAAAPEEKVLIDDSDAAEKTVEVTAEDFSCIRDMQPVRGMYVGNLLGNIDATLAVANSQEGGVYPPGTVVQIVPTEAMVKREAGFNAATNDWEFFVLDVSAEGTGIATRGGQEVKNGFGQDCFSCHAQAEPKWDMICETGHGCAPIPVTRNMIIALQKTDTRCAPMELTDEDKQALADLQKLIEEVKAQATEAAAASEPAAETAEETPSPAPDEEAVPVEEEEGEQ